MGVSRWVGFLILVQPALWLASLLVFCQKDLNMALGTGNITYKSVSVANSSFGLLASAICREDVKFPEVSVIHDLAHGVRSIGQGVQGHDYLQAAEI